jgi:hypothetical protein
MVVRQAMAQQGEDVVEEGYPGRYQRGLATFMRWRGEQPERNIAHESGEQCEGCKFCELHCGIVLGRFVARNKKEKGRVGC